MSSFAASFSSARASIFSIRFNAVFRDASDLDLAASISRRIWSSSRR